MTDPILTDLAALLRSLDPIPPDLIADAQAALGLAEIPDGCQLLEPIAGEPMLVRSGARSFRFGDNEIALDVELRRLPRRLTLVGLVSPTGEIQVCHPDGTRCLSPNPAGFFQIDDLPRGPVRIVVGGSHATRWFWA